MRSSPNSVPGVRSTRALRTLGWTTVSALSLLPAIFADARAEEPTRLWIGAQVFDPLDNPPVVAGELMSDEQGVEPWIVQFDRPIVESDREQLTALGATIHGYLPDFAFLVSYEAERASDFAALSGVRWTGPYHPAYRLSPAIGTMEFRNPERADASSLLLVVRVFGDLVTASERYRALGAEIVELIDHPGEQLVVLEAAESLLPALAREPLTWYIEEKPETFLLNNLTKWVVQSNATGSTPVWDRGLSGADEIVTVMDSGVDYNSCFFRDAGNAPPGPSHRKVIDYSEFGGEAYDGCGTGHGTHVAGTIAGDQSFINGSTDHAGMAFGAKLTVQDIGADGFFDCLLGFVNVPASLTSAYNASYALGARIHTNSWGSTSNAYDTYSVNVDQFMWTHPDYLIVFANGNGGPGSGTVGSPATAKNCVSVGASQQAPNQNTIASYSSRGPAGDTRFKPTVVAPGGDSNGYINSANNNSSNPPSATCAVQGSPFAGTSMATPAVAGTAALVREYFRRGFYPQGQDGGDALAPTGALIKAVLVNSGADVATPDIPNNNEGFGRVLLDDALYFDGDTRELRVEQDGGVSTSETRVYQYEIDSSSTPFEVALVWTDAPAASGAGVALVNDLDLVVTAPGGTVYLGNRLSAGQSTTGGSADRRNVEELFRLDSPPVGIYSIEVRGFNTPQGPQPFALASTGAFANWPEDSADVDDELTSIGGWSIVSVEPNPLSARTAITFAVPEDGGGVRIAVYDSGGREVRLLAEGTINSGSHSVVWDGRDTAGRALPSGIYFARIQAEGVELRAKLVLSR